MRRPCAHSLVHAYRPPTKIRKVNFQHSGTDDDANNNVCIHCPITFTYSFIYLLLWRFLGVIFSAPLLRCAADSRFDRCVLLFCMQFDHSLHRRRTANAIIMGNQETDGYNLWPCSFVMHSQCNLKWLQMVRIIYRHKIVALESHRPTANGRVEWEIIERFRTNAFWLDKIECNRFARFARFVHTNQKLMKHEKRLKMGIFSFHRFSVHTLRLRPHGRTRPSGTPN